MTRRGLFAALASVAAARPAAAVVMTLESANGTHELWRTADDPLNEFLQECCVLAPGSFVTAAEMMAAYTTWCNRVGEQYPLRWSTFTKRMLRSFAQSRRRRVEGKQRRTWEGIALKGGVSRCA